VYTPDDIGFHADQQLMTGTMTYFLSLVGRVVRIPALFFFASVGLSAQIPFIDRSQPDSTGAIPPLRVLFIGNSYTFYNDMPWQLQQIAASVGDKRAILTERVVKGGRSLKEHWEDSLALAAIHRGGWDIVVLQEHSLGALNAPDTMRKYMKLFCDEVKRIGAVPVLYMTWARRHRPESQDTIAKMYTSIGREAGALVAPVGLAWQRVRREYPALILFDPDGTHPSSEGSYLAACVFYAVFKGRCPLGADFSICIEQDDSPVHLVNMVYNEADILQRVAWETYLRYIYSP